MKTTKLSVTTYWLLLSVLIIITLFIHCILAGVNIRVIGSVAFGFLIGFMITILYHSSDEKSGKKDFLYAIGVAMIIGLIAAVMTGLIYESQKIFLLIWAGSALGAIISSVISVEDFKKEISKKEEIVQESDVAPVS